MKQVFHTGDYVIAGKQGSEYRRRVVATTPTTPMPFYVVEDDDGNQSTVGAHEWQDVLESSVGRRVIALTGDNRVGKSRTAANLADQLGSSGQCVRVMSLADPLRDIVYDANILVPCPSTGDGISWQGMEREARDVVNEALDGRPVDRRTRARLQNDWIKETYPESRDMLIGVGEAIRSFNPSYFVDIMLNDLDEAFSSDVDTVIIDDLRFAIEYETLRQMMDSFAVYHLQAPEGAGFTALGAQRGYWAEESGGLSIEVESLSGEGINKMGAKIFAHVTGSDLVDGSIDRLIEKTVNFAMIEPNPDVTALLFGENTDPKEIRAGYYDKIFAKAGELVRYTQERLSPATAHRILDEVLKENVYQQRINDRLIELETRYAIQVTTEVIWKAVEEVLLGDDDKA